MIEVQSLPVRVRLTGWYVLVLGAILLLFIGATVTILYWQLFYQMSRFAVQDVETIEGLLYLSPDGFVRMHQEYFNHPQSRLVLERLVEILSLDGKVLFRNDRLGNLSLGGKPFPGEGINGYDERSVTLSNGHRVLLVSRVHAIGATPLLLRLGYDQDRIWQRIREFLTAAGLALPILLALAAVFGYQFASRALAPLEQMALRAEQITAERLDQRLPIGNPHDELGHLARVINDVLDRLERSFEQLQRFTSDASHELRTPLAAIRSVGEVGLQKNRTAADYQDTIGSMLEEVTRLTKLVENLLTISRADAGEIQLTFTTFSPLELVRGVIALVEILAEERGQKLHASGDENLRVRGDRALLRQAIINVLHNAVKYSPVGGTVFISVGALAPERAMIQIRDSGPGIPREHRTKIFDRFYRVDAGRARDTGGAGLGLAIANWAVTAQGGQIRVEDGGEGAIFTLELQSAEPGADHQVPKRTETPVETRRLFG